MASSMHAGLATHLDQCIHGICVAIVGSVAKGGPVIKVLEVHRAALAKQQADHLWCSTVHRCSVRSCAGQIGL